MGDPVGEIEFLARSPKRVQLLQTVYESGNLEKGDLKTAVDGVRTTLTRNLEALEDRGWIHEDGRQYSITPSGEAVIEDFLGCVETVAAVSKLEALFRWVDPEAFDLDPRLLADADLVVAEPSAPYAMIDRHVARLREMEHCRVLLPITGLHAGEVSAEQIVDGGASAEVVVAEDVAEIHRSDPQYAAMVQEMVDTGRVEYYVFDGEMPYSIALIDEYVQIVVTEGDEPRALVETTAEDVYEWGAETFEAYKRQSKPMLVHS